MDDKMLMEQFALIAQGMAQMEDRLDKKFDSIEDSLTEKIRESEVRTKVYIENQVSKKIEALFDGYKLTHEKQWEMERRLDDLERKVEELYQTV